MMAYFHHFLMSSNWPKAEADVISHQNYSTHSV